MPLQRTLDGGAVPIRSFTANECNCGNCRETVPMDTAAETISGEYVCEPCGIAEFTACDGCSLLAPNGEIRSVDYSGEYCEDCHRDRFCLCDNCGCDVPTDESLSDPYGNGESYCEDCHSHLFRQCDDCADEFARDDLHETCGSLVCESCRTNYPTCDDCGSRTPQDELQYDEYREGEYCPDCQRSDSEWDSGRFTIPRDDAGYAAIRSRITFGVELETSKCPDHTELRGATPFGCKPDGSISGMEFVSPILAGDAGLREIRRFCDMADDSGFAVDASCGFHAHFGIGHLSLEQRKALALAYHLTYHVWKTFVSPNRQGNRFCAPHNYSAASVDEIGDDYQWESFCRRNGRDNSYYWANWGAWNDHRTVEIRLHTATLCGNKICNWVVAHARFISAVAEMGTLDNVWQAFRGSPREIFAAMCEIWNDSELAEFYAYRARKFGAPFDVPEPLAAAV